MYIEIYIDSLFLVNFVMNLYLLLLVNKSAYRTATRLRLVLGAAVGAVVYLVPFIWNGAVWVKQVSGIIIGTGLMILISFSVKTLQGYWKILEKLLLYSFLMGGGMLFVIRSIPLVRQHMMGIFGVMGIGAVVYLLITWMQSLSVRNHSICKVTLRCKGASMKVKALIDSGNSLVEPVSGKPVSVIEKKVFHGLYKELPELYRVIPYHSIGRKRGILKGYLLPEIQIEVDGITKVCKDVYVAVSEESITGDAIAMPNDREQEMQVKMLVNPVLLL